MAFIHTMARLTAPRPGERIPEIPKPRVRGRRRLRFARLDRLSQLCLSTAARAMWQAEGEGAPRPEDEELAGAALGTCFGAHLSNEQFQAGLMEEGQAGASPALFPYTLPSTAAGELSLHLGLRGPLITLAQGPSSGMAALWSAAEQVDSGRATWMLAGGADSLGQTLLRAAEVQVGGVTEGAAFFVVTDRTEGAAAELSAWASATGSGAAERATEQAGHAPGAREVRGGGQVCGAQEPLLVLAWHLAGGMDRALRLVWDHGDGSASAMVVGPPSL